MTPAAGPLQKPPMFRRRRFEASHQRPSLLQALLRPLGLALLLVGVPAACGIWVLTSSRFALTDIQVTSGDRVPNEWVVESLAPLRGRHVLLLSLAEVERLLAAHRWVDGVQVSKKLPNALVVEVLERVPVAVVRYQGAMHYVDREGRRIDQLAPDEGTAALLLIEGSTDRRPAIAAAVAAVEEIDAEPSKYFHAVLGVEILSGPDLKLSLADLPFSVFVRADRLQPAVRDFEQLLPKIARRYEGFDAVDLRFARQIVMKFPEA
jgi:cell division septal protein FtsQ